MKISKEDLDHMVDLGIIHESQSQKIFTYLNQPKSSNENLLHTLFSIIGTLLLSLGIILIIAHNWDYFTNPIRIAFSFLVYLPPIFCGIYFFKKVPHSNGWKEATSILAFFSIAANLSLISQIFQIDKPFEQFILTWIALAIPIMFLLSSLSSYLLFLLLNIHLGILLKTNDESLLIYYFVFLFIGIAFHYLNFKSKNNAHLRIISEIIIIISLFAGSIYLLNFSSQESKFAYFLLVQNMVLFGGLLLVWKKHP